MKRRVLGAAGSLLGALLIGGLGVSAVHAAPAPTPTTFTLPLFGAPLTIDITTGPGNALATVSVDSADPLTATTVKPKKVVFENADGTSKVVVKSKHGGQKVEARAGSLGDLTGPGQWKGDLFGDGTITTVDFTIADNAGAPDITGITTSDATAVIGEVKHSSGDDDDEMEQSARVTITFTSADGLQSRRLTIKVKVETDEDGTTSAKSSISLSGIRGVAVAAADAAGPHVWEGALCDNSAAKITYDVAEDGTISNVVATPTGADVRTEGKKAEVRFATGERVRIKVKAEDGTLRIDVREKFRCDSPDPVISGADVSTTVDDDDDDHEGDGGEHHRRRGGDDDHDDDNSSTTTSTTIA